eukprot:740817-Prymnesium_polylepis.1
MACIRLPPSRSGTCLDRMACTSPAPPGCCACQQRKASPPHFLLGRRCPHGKAHTLQAFA